MLKVVKNNFFKKAGLSVTTLSILFGVSFLGQNVHADAINTNNNLQSENINVNKSDADVEQTHNITETVNYVYEDGSQAAPSNISTVSFSRMDIENKENGIIVNPGGAWNSPSQTFAAVVSPTIPGYKADDEQIATQTVNPDSQNLTFTVAYHPVNNDESTVNESTLNKKNTPVKANDKFTQANSNDVVVENDISSNSPATTNTNANSNISKNLDSTSHYAINNNLIDTTNSKDEAMLPQTGAKLTNQILVSVLGMVLGILGIFGFSKKIEEKL